MSTPTKTPDASKCPIAYAIYGIDTLGRHFLHDVRQPEDDDWSTDDGGLGDRWAGNVLLHTNQEELELRNSELTARIAELEKELSARQDDLNVQFGMLQQARQTADSFREQLAEARKDSARIEKLDRLKLIMPGGWGGDDYGTVWRDPAAHWTLIHRVKDGTYKIPEALEKLTLREAIDQLPATPLPETRETL